MLGILRRVFSFTSWTTAHPNEPPPGDMLDASFDAQDQKISEIEALVADVRRSDGALQNGIVGIDQLHPDLKAALRIPTAKSDNGDQLGWKTAEAEADVWAHASKDWAEHMPDTIPDGSVAVMDITGDHWSSRWWAHQALLNASYVSGNPFHTPQEFGAVGDGVIDDTAAFQAAAASGFDIYVPAGRYKVNDLITIQNGRMWQGAGRTRSVIYVRATFNMSALGVLRLGTSEPGASLFDIGFEFDQNPAETVRANVIHYPPAIYAVDVARCQIDRVRISSAWDGILMTGNSGGSWLGRLEIGAINRGLKIDGAQDFIHGESWHFWSFGIPAAGIGLGDIYRDGTTVACELGRADLFAIDKIGAFQGNVLLDSTTPQIASHSIGSLQMDSNAARLICTSVDNWQIGTLTSSKSAGTFGPDVIVSAGRVRIASAYISGSRTGPAVSVTTSGASLAIEGGFLSQANSAEIFAAVTGGRLHIRGTTVAPPASNRTAPYIQQSGTGVLIVQSCDVLDATWTGPLVEIGVDAALNNISGNNFMARSLTLPASVALGCYGPNRLAKKVWTPVVTFATPGDFAPTYGLQQGFYWHETNGVYFECRIQFDTNAFTTAAGQARVTGLPVSTVGSSGAPITVGIINKIDFTTGYTQMTATINSAGYVVLSHTGDNVAAADLSIANIKPSTTTILISLSGFIPTI